MMKKVINQLSSRRTAILLLFILTILFVAGSFLPQVSFLPASRQEEIRSEHPLLYLLGSYLSPARLSGSVLFLILSFLLFLSLLFCTLQRWGKEGERRGRVPFSWRGKWRPGVEEEVRRFCRRWEKVRDGEGKFLARRGKWGRRGSLIFHGGMAVVIAGAFVGYLSGYKGGMVVTEGQTLPVTPENFVMKYGSPLIGGPDDIPVIRVERVTVVKYDEKHVRQYRVEVTVLDREGRERQRDVVEVNRPLLVAGHRLVLEDYGVAPYLVIRDKDSGRVLGEAYYNLRVLRKPWQKEDPVDYVELPGGGRLQFRFFPDFERRGDKIGSRSWEIKNPVLWVTAGDSNALLFPGEEKAVGPYLVRFGDLRRWAFFRVTWNPGEKIAWFGFVLTLMGLTLRFFDPEMWLLFAIREEGEEKVWYLGGRASYFPQSFAGRLGELARRLDAEAQPVMEGSNKRDE